MIAILQDRPRAHWQIRDDDVLRRQHAGVHEALRRDPRHPGSLKRAADRRVHAIRGAGYAGRAAVARERHRQETLAGLFRGGETTKTAQRLAVGYTIFGSCRMHEVNPLAWATDVIGKLQAGWPRDRLDELLPDAWARSSRPAPSAGDADAA
ncbi:transposase domain-containing protein [Sorangium sp. So ce131]